MKKAIVWLLLSVILVVGILFFVSTNIKKEVNSLLSANNNISVLKSEFNKGIFESNGVLEGKITKEKMNAEFRKNIEKLLDFYLDEESKKAILEFDDLNKEEIFKYDFDFRYTYKIKHSIISIKDGFESEGTVQILTPYYAKISQEMFKTDIPVKLKIMKNLNSLNFDVYFVDINHIQKDEKALLKDAKYSMTLVNNETEIEKAEINIGSLIIAEDELDTEISDLKIAVRYDTPINKNAPFANFLLNDNNQSVFLGNFFINEKTSGIKASLKDAVLESNTFIQDDGFIKMSSKNKISKFSFDDYAFNNITFDYDMGMDKKLYENVIAKSGGFINQQKLDQILNNFGKGIEIDIKDFSFKNKTNDRFDFKAFIGLISSNTKLDEKLIIDNLKINGQLKFSSTIEEFFKDYPDLKFISEALSDFKGFVRDGNGLKMDFVFDPLKEDLILNETTSLKQLFSYENADEKDIEIFKENAKQDLLTLIYDLNLFYTSQNEFDEYFENMTDVSVDKVLPNSGYIQIDGKKCIKVSFFKNNEILEKPAFIKIQKGYDEKEDVCEKLYDDTKIKYILNFMFKYPNNGRLVSSEKGEIPVGLEAKSFYDFLYE